MAANEHPRSTCLALVLLVAVTVLARRMTTPNVTRHSAVFAEINPTVHQRFQQEAQEKAKLASTKGILGEPCLLYIIAATLVAVVIMEPEQSAGYIVYWKYMVALETALCHAWWLSSYSTDFRLFALLFAWTNGHMLVDMHDPIHTYWKKCCECVCNCMGDRGRGRSSNRPLNKRSRTPQAKSQSGRRTRSRSSEQP
jgi:hypothetical protein